jgi:DNA-binding NarL/FixJ family response regulator
MQHAVFLISPLPETQQAISQILQADPSLSLHSFASASEAVRQCKELGCKISILDCELDSSTLQDLANSLRSVLPETYLLIIPPEAQKGQAYFPVLGFLPDGYVWRPFNPEELVEQINELLRGGPEDENLQSPFPLEPLFDVPPPEPVQDIQPNPQAGYQPTPSTDFTTRAENKPESKQTIPQEPRIKEAEAVKFLPRLLETTEAQFALLIRNQKSWVLSGSIPKKAVDEIKEQVLSVYPNGSTGNAIFFLHLQSNETDYQAFLSYLEDEVLLVLAFDAQFPLRKIRLLTRQQILNLFDRIAST